MGLYFSPISGDEASWRRDRERLLRRQRAAVLTMVLGFVCLLVAGGLTVPAAIGTVAAAHWVTELLTGRLFTPADPGKHLPRDITATRPEAPFEERRLGG